MQSQLISVIIPCYNQGVFLSESIKCIINQTYSKWECIIVNDGSKDNTEEIAKKFQQLDPRIKYLKKSNGGLSSARNAGLALAKGDYIQFLDADDLIDKKKFELQISQVKDKHNCIAITDYLLFDSNTGKEISKYHLSPFLSLTSFKSEIVSDWEYRKSIPCHCLLIPKILIDNHSLVFDEELPNHEDWVFWCQLFYFSFGLIYLYEPLALYRQHSNAMTNNVTLMTKGHLLAAQKLCRFYKKVNNKALYIETRKKYKEIKNRSGLPTMFVRVLNILRKVKRRVYR